MPEPVTVRLVVVKVTHADVVPEIDQVPEPTAIVLVLEFDELTPEAAPDKVTLYVAASKVPAVITKAFAVELLVTKASCNVTEPLGVFIAIG